MHEGTTDFLKLSIIIVSIAGFLYWLHSSFGPYYALGAVIIAVILLFGTVMFVAGSGLAHKIQKNTLEGISKFNAKDAMIDRYRMKSLHEATKANAYQVKLETQKQLIDYKQAQKQLPLANNPEKDIDTFWTNNETVDLDDWS